MLPLFNLTPSLLSPMVDLAAQSPVSGGTALSDLAIHLQFQKTGDLGRKGPIFCREIFSALKRCNINVVVIASYLERSKLE
jgi:hypothetical protein